MEYQEARACIDESLRFGHEMNLKAITELLSRMGNPEKQLKFIHIAGTNGKGSVNAYLTAVLSCAGLSVGRFVSPSLYGYCERIQINHDWIPEEEFGEEMDRVWPHVRAMAEEGLALPTPFEIETALAFSWFARRGVDLVLLECGMGGRDDATNVIQNTLVCIITSISMDHMEYLGDTLPAIARTKAGILKPGAVMVTGHQTDEVTRTLEDVCEAQGNAFVTVDQGGLTVLSSAFDRQVFTYKGLTLTIPLAGQHQVENATLAAEALFVLREQGYAVSDESIMKGLAEARWPGRFCQVAADPIFIVDGAHNPGAANRLYEALEAYFPDREKVFCMAMLKDKQVDEVCRIMAPLAKCVYTMETPDNDRAMTSKALARHMALYHREVHSCESLRDAVFTAGERARKEGAMVVCFGSLSFIGELTEIITSIYAGETN